MAEKAEVLIDEEAYKEFKAAHDRISIKWIDGASEIIKSKNPQLLEELDRTLSVLDSLIAIPDKPASIRKQWRETLAMYEKVADQCVIYAKRHMALVA